MNKGNTQGESGCGFAASARTNVRLAAFLLIVVLNVGQFAGCNAIVQNATPNNPTRLIDHVCVGAWPICLSYDIAYDYMKQRLQRNAEKQ
jgi:hypothetical protein